METDIKIILKNHIDILDCLDEIGRDNPLRDAIVKACMENIEDLKKCCPGCSKLVLEAFLYGIKYRRF